MQRQGIDYVFDISAYFHDNSGVYCYYTGNFHETNYREVQASKRRVCVRLSNFLLEAQRCLILDTRCWSNIPSLAGIKTFSFTATGNIINLLYGPFRKNKKVIKFLISFPLKTGFPLSYNKYQETSIQYLYIIWTTIY